MVARTGPSFGPSCILWCIRLCLVALLTSFSYFRPCRLAPPSRTPPSSRSPLPSRCRLARCLAGTFALSVGDEAVRAIKRARGSRLGLPPSLFASPSAIAPVRTPVLLPLDLGSPTEATLVGGFLSILRRLDGIYMPPALFPSSSSLSILLICWWILLEMPRNQGSWFDILRSVRCYT